MFGILIIFFLLNLSNAQEKQLSCEDCIELVYNEERSCIYELNIGWGEECIKYKKMSFGSNDEFDEYVKKIELCRNLIKNGGCKENIKKCNVLLGLTNSKAEYVSAGDCYVKLGECEKAEEPYKKAIELYENEEENYIAIAYIYAKLAACYKLKDDQNKEKEYYMKAGYYSKKDADELLKAYEQYPKIFNYNLVVNASAREYTISARFYKAADDYENACISCQKANKCYKEINKTTIDCKKYGCKEVEQQKYQEQFVENREALNYNLVLIIAIILITILLSTFVIWHKKFKR